MNTDEQESTANQPPKRRAQLRPRTGVRAESKKQNNNLLTRSASFEMTHYRILRWPRAPPSFKARKKQNFLDNLSNSGPAVRLYDEAKATPGPEDCYWKR